MEQGTAVREKSLPAAKMGLLNLLAAMGVLWIHAESWEQFGFSETDWCAVFEREFLGACEWAVPLFFLLSAYLFFRGFTWRALLPKWKRRIRTVAVPYLLWNTLYFLLFALLPRIPAVARFINAAPAPLTAIEILRAVFLHTYDGHFWFLRILMLFLACAPAFYAVFCRKWLSEAALAGAFLLMLWNPAPPVAIAYFSWRMLFFYAAGAYLALRRPSVLFYTPPRAVRIGLLLLVPAAVLVNARFDSEFYSVVMIGLLWFGIDESTLKNRFVYGCTFFIYASHMLLFSILKKVLLALLPHTQTAALLAYLVLPLLALPLLTALAWGMGRVAPRLTALLTGGRVPHRAAQAASASEISEAK